MYSFPIYIYETINNLYEKPKNNDICRTMENLKKKKFNLFNI